MVADPEIARLALLIDLGLLTRRTAVLRCGVSRSTVKRWLRGSASPSAQRRARLVDLLDSIPQSRVRRRVSAARLGDSLRPGSKVGENILRVTGRFVRAVREGDAPGAEAQVAAAAGLVRSVLISRVGGASAERIEPGIHPLGLGVRYVWSPAHGRRVAALEVVGFPDGVLLCCMWDRWPDGGEEIVAGHLSADLVDEMAEMGYRISHGDH